MIEGGSGSSVPLVYPMLSWTSFSVANKGMQVGFYSIAFMYLTSSGGDLLRRSNVMWSEGPCIAEVILRKGIPGLEVCDYLCVDIFQSTESNVCEVFINTIHSICVCVWCVCVCVCV